MRRVGWVLTTAILLAGAVIGLCTVYLNRIGAWSQGAAELEALQLARQITDAGSAPSEWSTRLFIPVSALQAVAEQFVGGEARIAHGAADAEGKRAGQFVLRLTHLEIASAMGWLRPKLELELSYSPERERPAWAEAKLTIHLEAMILPKVNAEGQRLAAVHLVPIRVAPAVEWQGLTFDTRHLFDQAIAAKIYTTLADRLALPVPAPNNLALSTAVGSREHAPFKGGGSVDVTVNYPGVALMRQFPLRVALPTPWGVWLLGDPARQIKAVPAVTSEPATVDAEVVRQRTEIGSRLTAWQRTDGQFFAAIKGELLRDVVSDVLPPRAPRRLELRTANATGEIDRLRVMRDNLLGEVALEVRPEGSDFARADMDIGNAAVSWSSRGIAAKLPLSAVAHAQVHLHFHTGNIGGGMGTSVGIDGAAQSELSINAQAALVETGKGRAFIIQPVIACQRVQIDLTTKVELAIIKAPKVGIRLHKHVGGDRMRPLVLLDDIVRSIPYPRSGPGSDVSFSWPASAITLQMHPNNLVADETTLTMGARLVIGRTRDVPSAEAMIQRQRELAELLFTKAPASPCTEPEEIAALIAGAEAGPNNELVVFAKRALAEGKRIADETKKEVEKLVERPLDSIKDLPDNVVREGKRGIDNALNAAKEAPKKIEEGGKHLLKEGEKLLKKLNPF